MSPINTVTALNEIFDTMYSGKEDAETVEVVRSLVGEVARINAELQNAAESGEYHPNERQIEAKKEMFMLIANVYHDSYPSCEQLVQRLHNEACEKYQLQ